MFSHGSFVLNDPLVRSMCSRFSINPIVPKHTGLLLASKGTSRAWITSFCASRGPGQLFGSEVMMHVDKGSGTRCLPTAVSSPALISCLFIAKITHGTLGKRETQAYEWCKRMAPSTRSAHMEMKKKLRGAARTKRAKKEKRACQRPTICKQLNLSVMQLAIFSSAAARCCTLRFILIVSRSLFFFFLFTRRFLTFFATRFGLEIRTVAARHPPFFFLWSLHNNVQDAMVQTNM
ncbi:hypothetical protein BC940DRAFT_110281 [Gongronella butleri]|nr:hypothetical protein BC940DRAFT_110281 [Gongronella butleri]